jgi:hypothetical protein
MLAFKCKRREQTNCFVKHIITTGWHWLLSNRKHKPSYLWAHVMLCVPKITHQPYSFFAEAWNIKFRGGAKRKPRLLSRYIVLENLFFFPGEKYIHFLGGFASTFEWPSGQCGASLIISRSGRTVQIQPIPVHTACSRPILPCWAPAMARPAAVERVQLAPTRNVRPHMPCHARGQCKCMHCSLLPEHKWPHGMMYSSSELRQRKHNDTL